MNEYSLANCLDLAKQPELPPEWDGKTPYTKAIVLVSKYDGTSNYAMAAIHRDCVIVSKDFGNSAIICSIDAIYPYEYLEIKNNQTSKNDEGTRKNRKSKKEA